MMNEKETTRISKFLSLVLRHKPEAISISLDEQGWVSVEELLAKLNAGGMAVSVEQLEYVVATNNKKRFAFNEDKTRIRASQGHSVTVDLGYAEADPPEILYHGTAEKNLSAILKEGIARQSRSHVHLSADTATAIQVGQRHGKPVVLEVLAGQMRRDGHAFYLSANGVWLTEQVPAGYVRKNSE